MLFVTKYEAPWCAPCKVAQQELDKLVEAGKIELTRVDISTHPDAARAAGVRSVPTLIVYDSAKGQGEIGRFDFTSLMFLDLVNVKED